MYESPATSNKCLFEKIHTKNRNIYKDTEFICPCVNPVEL